MSLLSFTLGCAVCMGSADSKTGPALNAAIFLLMGFIGGMLALISAVGWSIVRRSRQMGDQSLPPDLTPEKF